VPRRAVGLDHEPLVRPPKVRHDTATLEDHGSIHLRASESVGQQQVEHQILEFAAGGRWTRRHDSSELRDPAPPASEPP
jgi:hypothetical protein